MAFLDDLIASIVPDPYPNRDRVISNPSDPTVYQPAVTATYPDEVLQQQLEQAMSGQKDYGNKYKDITTAALGTPFDARVAELQKEIKTRQLYRATKK